MSLGSHISHPFCVLFAVSLGLDDQLDRIVGSTSAQSLDFISNYAVLAVLWKILIEANLNRPRLGMDLPGVFEYRAFRHWRIAG